MKTQLLFLFSKLKKEILAESKFQFNNFMTRHHKQGEPF